MNGIESSGAHNALFDAELTKSVQKNLQRTKYNLALSNVDW